MAGTSFSHLFAEIKVSQSSASTWNSLHSDGLSALCFGPGRWLKGLEHKFFEREHHGVLAPKENALYELDFVT